MFSTTLSNTILKYYNTLKNALYKNKLTQFLTDHNFTGKILPNKIMIIHLARQGCEHPPPALLCLPIPMSRSTDQPIRSAPSAMHEWHCHKINSNQLFLLLCQPTESKPLYLPGMRDSLSGWRLGQAQGYQRGDGEKMRLLQQRSKLGWGDARNPLKVKPPLARTLQNS